MLPSADFMWTCPACGWDQTERVTADGPVMSLICESCTNEFSARELPREILRAWDAAIEDVVPKTDLVAEWYEYSTTEQERKAILGNIAGAMEYGLTKSWTCLHEHARLIVRREYRRITSKSS